MKSLDKQPRSLKKEIPDHEIATSSDLFVKGVVTGLRSETHNLILEVERVISRESLMNAKKEIAKIHRKGIDLARVRDELSRAPLMHNDPESLAQVERDIKKVLHSLQVLHEVFQHDVIGFQQIRGIFTGIYTPAFYHIFLEREAGASPTLHRFLEAYRKAIGLFAI